MPTYAAGGARASIRSQESKHVWRARVDLGRRGYPSYTVPMMKPLAIAQEIWARYGKGFVEEK